MSDPAPTPPLRAWLQALRPARTAVNARERWHVAVGAALGVALVVLLCRPWAGGGNWPWMVAPMGASAVLVFAVPESPFAHPWSVVGGNLVSALVGVACVHLLGPPQWSAAPAVGLAILAMFALRCLHPPGGATALLATWLGAGSPRFALDPVGVNALTMVLAGLLFHNATGRAYPRRRLPVVPPTIDDDLDAVLARHNRVVDIAREDLKELLAETQLRGYQRRLGLLRCADIMSRGLVTVGHATPAAEAWPLFARHHIKALPVMDAQGALVGIVTPADFMRGEQRVTQGRVGELMTRQVRVARAEQPLAELIPLFSGSGHHHIPVVAAGNRLVGIVTQSDVVAALAAPRG